MKKNINPCRLVKLGSHEIVYVCSVCGEPISRENPSELHFIVIGNVRHPVHSSCSYDNMNHAIESLQNRVKLLEEENLKLLRELDEVAVPETDYDQHLCHGCARPCETVYCSECSQTAECHHGYKIGQCDACDREGDFAYDTSRESR